MNESRPAVFLDRDGTLNVEREGYIADPDDLELMPGAVDAVRRVNESGWMAVVVTNQSGVGRGIVTPDALTAVHNRLDDLLSAGGARLDGIFYCPHAPSELEPCPCRKPLPGLLLRASERLQLNLSASFLVGDDIRDMAAARAAGVIPVLVRTGKGARAADAPAPEGAEPAHVADDIGAAVDWILTQRQGDRG